MKEMDEIKRLLVEASHIISNEGLCDAYGHVSARLPGTDLYSMPAVPSPALVTGEDLLTINMDDQVVEGQGEQMNESWLHTCIYRLRPDVNAVAHTHSLMVVTLGATGQVVRPLHNQSMTLARFTNIQLFDRPGLINTEELGMEAARKLGSEPALMLRGHGANVVGSGIRQAVFTALKLEEAAKVQILAAAAGQPRFYTAEECESGFPRNRTSSPAQMKRAWDYYVDRLPGRQ
ncbi:MAG: class II aldolase/adducin family protein [Syntrophales bacterium LBB04]|nr:class II aldolase/adducin family protein [Syntrophales bacterium LBB04]